MLEFVDGDFFEFDADVRINTVNCVGIMGAGVALAFKQKYPDMFKEYVRQCKGREITPGNPSVWIEGDMLSKRVEIINFPTKDHWKKPSKYEYIEKGLIWLSEYLKKREGLTVTLPALGCGHGGLDWKEVKILIKNYLEDTSNHILVFEPETSKNIGKNLPLTLSKISDMKALGIEILSKKSIQYPTGLMRYTEKNLYALGNLNSDFDVSLISSTKPSEEEKEIINKFVDYCQANGISILFGGTAFDKKMAAISMRKGVNVGVFLASGIFESAEKMIIKGNNENISILSIGDPFKSFDKKEYIPSVLSRIFVGKCVFFTTDKLAWLKNQKNILLNNRINSYFINYDELKSEDYLAVTNINAKPVEITSTNAFFEELKI